MTTASVPYPGLRPFRKDEHAFFFGRYEHTAALYRLLDRGRMLAILGGSGSGKSSLILAGLLPLLEQEKRGDGTPRWSIVSLRPGSHPLRRLASALLDTAAREGESVQRAIAGLRRTSRGLATEIERLLPGDNEILILVDQFEELFRYADAADKDDVGNRASAVAKLSRDDESRRFIDLLLSAATFSARRIRVVITMRSDFLGDCARYRGLAEAVSANQYLAPWLDRDQQTEAIVGPLLRGAGRLDAGVFELTDTKVKDWSDLIEPQLVEQLLNDAGDEPDQLPVLQHALRRCWRGAAGSRLTLQGYRDSGGWGVILSNHADKVMRRCGAGRASTVERMFRALIERDGNGRAIRRPCTIAQLIDETGEQETDIREVIARFSAADCSFLAPPTPPDELIDIGHEALIRRWRKIAHPARGWLQEEARDGMVWQLLMFQAQAHEENAEEVLSPAVVEQRQPWFEQHNEHWANRYGGQWPQVDKLMRASNRARITSRRTKWAARGAMLAFSLGLLMTWAVTQEAKFEQAKAEAVSIGLQLEFPDGAVESGDRNALLELAKDEDGAARLAFITQVSKSPELAGRLARNASMVIRALVGVDSARREEVIDYAFGPKANVPQDGTTLYARALLGAELATTPQAIKLILEALENGANPVALGRLAQGLAALPVELSGEQASNAVKPFVEALQNAVPNDVKLLAEGLALLPVGKLNAIQAEQAVNSLRRDIISNTSDPKALGFLGQGLAALAPKLLEEQAESAIEPTLNAMRGSDHSVALKGLAEGLAALPITLTDAQTEEAVKPFLDAMQKTEDPKVVKRLAEGLAAVSNEIPTADAAAAIEPFLATMNSASRSNELKPIAQALAALPFSITDAQTEAAVKPFFKILDDKDMDDPFVLKRLAEGLAALAPELTDAQVVQAVERLVNALEKNAESYGLEPLGDGLAALTSALTEAQAEIVFEPIMAALRSSTNPDALGLIAQGAAVLSVEFTAAQAAEIATPILAAMQKTSDPNTLAFLGEGLAKLAPKLAKEQAEKVVKPVLAMMWETNDTAALKRLAEGLSALTAHLNGAQAAQPLIDAIKMPWTAGPPSELLLKALRNRLQLIEEGRGSIPGLWETLAQAKLQLGSEINLISPPREPLAISTELALAQ